MRQAGEPSVEEILESIKKVIARDNRETLQVERRHRASVGVEEPAEPVEPAEPAEPAEPVDTEEAEDVLELDEADAQLPESPDEPPAVEVPAEDTPVLTTESAARSMRESLAALAMVAEPAAQSQVLRPSETSLEGLTRELLRPMLAQWLDHNLPPIVERLVKAEIARIAGTRG